jgi:anti-sigma regulatory factor (Ser/Thr protein kinase)
MMGSSRIRIQFTVAPSPEASRKARLLLEPIPDLEPYPDLLFAAQLLAHELVANSVRHARPAGAQPVRLTVECDGQTLSVEVSDRGPGFDPLSALAEHWRRQARFHGLFLLDSLADRWGYRRDRVGFGIWFEIDLVPGRRPWHGRKPLRTRGDIGATDTLERKFR